MEASDLPSNWRGVAGDGDFNLCLNVILLFSRVISLSVCIGSGVYYRSDMIKWSIMLKA